MHLPSSPVLESVPSSLPFLQDFSDLLFSCQSLPPRCKSPNPRPLMYKFYPKNGCKRESITATLTGLEKRM